MNPQLQATFLSAVSKMDQQQWSPALEDFLTIRKQATSSELENNIAHCLFKLDRKAESLKHANLANLLSRGSEADRQDLAYYQNQIPGSWGLPMQGTSENLAQIYTYVRPGEIWAGASVLFVAWLWVFFYFRKRSIALSVLILGLVLGLLVLGVALKRVEQFAVITAESPLHPAPLASTNPVMKLGPGTRIKVLKESGDFYDVERIGSFRGWVAKDRVIYLYLPDDLQKSPTPDEAKSPPPVSQ